VNPPIRSGASARSLAGASRFGATLTLLAIGAASVTGVPGFGAESAPAPTANRVLATDLAFPEGPVVLPGGDVVAVEIMGNQLARVTPAGKSSVLAKLGPGPNGAALGPDGALYVLTNGGAPGNTNGGSVQRLDLGSGAIRTLYTECDGQRLKGPNDIVFDANGDFWFTDFAGGALYWARTDGSGIRRIADLPGANGIALAPDRHTLYVVEVQAHRVAVLNITGRGTVQQANGAAQVTLLPPIEQGSLDSMKVEADGNLLLASGEVGITTLSPDGKVLAQTAVNGLRVTNLAFGGLELRTLYVTGNQPGGMQGSIVQLPWPRPGLKLLYN